MGPQEDPWDIDKEYNPPEYVLAGGQRDFITASDPQVYKGEKRPTETIEQKAARLESRFQDLFDDVALFKYGDFLSETSWEEITDINSRASILNDEEVFFTQEEHANPDIQFGFALGSLISTLQDTARHESDWKDVAWGFVLGFCGAPDRGTHQEKEQLRDFKREIDRRKKPREQLGQRQSDGIDFLLKRQQDSRETIKEVLEKNNIKPLDVILDWIYSELRSRGNPITETLVEEFLEEEIDQKTLESANKLHRALINDAKTLEKEGYTNPDVQAAEVLQATRPTKDLTSREIATAASAPESNVTGILYRLSGTTGKEMWTNYPVVSGDTNGWRLTDYGKIISEILFEFNKPQEVRRQKNPAAWIYDYALDPGSLDEDKRDMIENMIQEIGIDLGMD